MGFMDCFTGKRKEFHLENVIEQNRLHPRTFLLPESHEIDSLETGSLVRLIFVMEKVRKNGCRTERIWVRITKIENGGYTGMLDNQPCYLKSISYGDTITFDRENIASFYMNERLFNPRLMAMITRKAVEKRQINWVLRSDDLHHEQDSGWQLFYGDESQSYLDDPQNAALISLDEALSFEPLLEQVFIQKGNTYEYSAQQNRFIEVRD